MMPVLKLFAPVISLLLLLSATRADAGTVALVAPDCASQTVTETLSRIHGELLAVGLDVTQVAPPKRRDIARNGARSWVETLANDLSLDAIIDLDCDSSPMAIEVWTIERNPNRVELSRVIGEPNSGDSPERLAIRTTEMLRSVFVARGLLGTKKVAERTVHSTKQSHPPLDSRASKPPHSRMSAELGATWLMGTDGIGPAVMPVLAIDWKPLHWLSFRGETGGFGSKPSIASEAGNTEVAQHYFMFGPLAHFRSTMRMSPFVSLSVGALRTSVRGYAERPRLEHTTAQWSMLFDGSVGSRLRLSERFYVTLAAHVQLAEPYVAIRVLDGTVATAGRPNLALTATIGVWL
jgi:hypothetical protein